MLPLELRIRILSLQSQPHGVSATNTDFLKAEELLGLQFPDTYKSFLMTIGWGGIAHFEFYGLGKDVPSFLDLVQETLYERTEGCPHLPNQLLPILNDGAGNHYCLDVAKTKSGDCPVVFWDHELGEIKLQKSRRTHLKNG